MQYTTAALFLLAVLILVPVLALTRALARRDCARLSDAELSKLLLRACRRLAVAGADRERYEAALASTGRLMCEMKRRGGFATHEFAPSDSLHATLSQLAQERFAQRLEKIQELSMRGDATALHRMAVLLGEARESDTARQYLEMAAEAGHADSQFALALRIFSRDDELTPERLRTGIHLLRLAARQGHAQARRGLEGVLQSLSIVPIQPAEPGRARGARPEPAGMQPSLAGSASLHNEHGLSHAARQVNAVRPQPVARSGWRAAFRSRAGRGMADGVGIEHDAALFALQESRLT